MKSFIIKCRERGYQAVRSVWSLVNKVTRHHLWRRFSYLYRYRPINLLLRRATNSFILQVLYFVSLSFLGFFVLKSINPRGPSSSPPPRYIDLFFTSVSAATVSSMSTVEMELFSDSQLIVLTILMFIGGEVFTSMVGLHLKKHKLRRQLRMISLKKNKMTQLSAVVVAPISDSLADDVQQQYCDYSLSSSSETTITSSEDDLVAADDDVIKSRYHSIRLLGFMVLGYLVIVHALGIALVSIYLRVVSRARNVLAQKGLKSITFSIFTVVSTFASCGFVPTNENMIVFRNNSGLLLILIPQILMGNTLFPSCLRFCLWLLGKFTTKWQQEVGNLLNRSKEVRYLHLLPKMHSKLVVVTVMGFIGIQFAFFCLMEWSSQQLIGLTTYEKIIGVLFQCVNSRHTGETIVDLSVIAPAVLVLFVVMMYLPPYTSFLPVNVDSSNEEGGSEREPRYRGELLENIIMSQLSYLVIFIILVCITERENIKNDPLNFNVLNIVVEVISAYGNVGFTMGYSCKRQVNPDEDGGCIDKWIGFSGKWSDPGKILLILVMIFGRLKKFNMNGGRAWKLL